MATVPKPRFIEQLRLEAHADDPDTSSYARKQLRKYGSNGGKASARTRRRRAAAAAEVAMQLATMRHEAFLEEFRLLQEETNQDTCPID